jgi:hypothetical protein
VHLYFSFPIILKFIQFDHRAETLMRLQSPADIIKLELADNSAPLGFCSPLYLFILPFPFVSTSYLKAQCVVSKAMKRLYDCRSFLSFVNDYVE